MKPWKAQRFGRALRRRVRGLVVGGVLLVLSMAMLVMAGLRHGFARDLLLNVGASLVLAGFTYAIVDPIFDEARKARVQMHERFDKEAFIEVMRDTDRNVRILDTWTLLLDQNHRTQTLKALRVALERGAEVKMLLLDPDSSAAQQRAEELERRNINVAGQIMDNLRCLYEFREGLVESMLQARLNVSVYDASPSIQLYQWDGRALISFFPIGEVSFDVPQLEVDMASPWGQFVDRRFEDLWQQQKHLRSLDRYWLLDVNLMDDGVAIESFTVPYASIDSEHIYIDGAGPIANRLADHILRGSGKSPANRTASITVSAVWPPRHTEQPPTEFRPLPVQQGLTPGTTEVSGLFDRKYGGYSPPSQHDKYLLRLVSCDSVNVIFLSG